MATTAEGDAHAAATGESQLIALVTGAGGFLGQYIVEQLVGRGDQVRARAPQDAGARTLGVECIHGDIRELADVKRACRGVEVVFHAAAVAGIWGSWKHFYDTNVLGTKNVISGCCHRAGDAKAGFHQQPQRHVCRPDQCGVDESAPYPSAGSPTIRTRKALAEQMVLRPMASTIC